LLVIQGDFNKLAESVRIVHQSGYYISGLAKRVSPNISIAKSVAPKGISNTEHQILYHVAKGLSDKEVADTIHIAPGTVRNYIGTVKRKLGLKNRIQVVTHAISHGWIKLET
jgi:DNA-binding NarL/FixJ family response regulator